MIYLVVLSALYALHLLLKLHWITTVVIGGFLLLRISGHRKWYKKKIVYERKFEEASEYLDMLLYAFVKEEKVERALVNVDAAMVDGPMRGVLQKAIDHMHMTFDETDVMRDSLQMIEREYACSRIKYVHDFIVHVEIYGGGIERPVELLLADKKRLEQRICGSIKERRKMFVDIVMSIAASLLICGMILYLPVMEIDISKNLISQVLTIVVVILDDLIFTRAQKYLAIDWLALDGHTDAGIEQPQRGVHVADGSHRGPGVAPQAALINDDRGGEVVDTLHFGLFVFGQPPPHEGSIGLVHLPLALGGDGVKDDAGLPRAGHTGKHHDLALGNIQ